MSQSEADALAHKYQAKTEIAQVLDNPDTFTGSMQVTDAYDVFIFSADVANSDANTKTLVPKDIMYIPGLYKLFDECIVNCRDHAVRMADLIARNEPNSLPVTDIHVQIKPDGVISLTNNGNGIDVAIHPEKNIWIPELIFAHMRTSTNYDKSEKKTVGGKNGFGFKLVLIWSTWGKIETVDHVRGLKYVQEFGANLSIIHPPKITTTNAKKPYTTVSFKPDYQRLGIDGLSADVFNLFKRRVYDIAAVTDKSIKIHFNGELVPVKSFAHYTDLYLGDKTETPRLHENSHPRWEFIVCLAPKGTFTQISFVNGICTSNGGRHVDYIVNQILKKMAAYIKEKKKVDVKSNTIRELLAIFLRCDIDNPAFDSQTKEYMNTAPQHFGSAFEVSDKFIEKLAKMGVLEQAYALNEVKETKAAKKSDGSKSRSIRGIPKLTDANDAGGANSHKCSLILCEGDSAKSGIISGLTALDRNTIGVYPLRGKLFNVRGETAKRIAEVKEVTEIKQILGLQVGKKYHTSEDVKRWLRYGQVIFMTDQDLDGSHIKGLCINLFDAEWDTLLSVPGFITFMNTPIIKASKGKQEMVFYNDGEYNAWKAGTTPNSWTIKYYKGLGTSTPKEFKDYFAKRKVVEFTSTGAASRDAIDMAFNKKRAKDRQQWLMNYDRTLYLDTNQPQVSYERFIKEELVHFSQKDCERSIPNVHDGLKTSNRKILFTCFKRRLTSSVKVAQLAGSVSELSCYHHGDTSLHGAIANMAQNFVGSNNINLMFPDGQFGTRLQGGNDAASPRYINTRLEVITRAIFPEADDQILTYLEDDGVPVEPIHYVPIIPMLLINGSKGIGTGFSTDIMCYNPLEIIDYMIKLLQGQSPTLKKFVPYYEGFKGTIVSMQAQEAQAHVPEEEMDVDEEETNSVTSAAAAIAEKFLIKGKYEILNDKQIRITELPIATWTDDYKQFLEDLIDKNDNSKKANIEEKAKGTVVAKGKRQSKTSVHIAVKDYQDNSTDVNVDITITLTTSGQLPSLLEMYDAKHGITNLEKALKLYTTRTTSNMHAFDENEKLIRYANVNEIIAHFMRIRMQYYEKRKIQQLLILKKDLLILSNKARFIMELLNDTLELRKKTTAEVQQLMLEHKYDVISEEDTHFKYLVQMPMNSVTKEHVTRLLTERDNKMAEVTTLENTTPTKIWLAELANLRAHYLDAHTTEIVAKATKFVVKKRKI